MNNKGYRKLKMRNASWLAAGLVLAGVLNTQSAHAGKTSVTIWNCSKIDYLTYKSYDPWDDDKTLPYQFGRGMAYPVDSNHSDYVECNDELWFEKYDECYVRVSKSGLVDVTQKLKAGTWKFTVNHEFKSGGDCFSGS
jgi:hypothetical protein